MNTRKRTGLTNFLVTGELQQHEHLTKNKLIRVYRKFNFNLSIQSLYFCIVAFSKGKH